jgi:hypothetical protein
MTVGKDCWERLLAAFDLDEINVRLIKLDIFAITKVPKLPNPLKPRSTSQRLYYLNQAQANDFSQMCTKTK